MRSILTTDKESTFQNDNIQTNVKKLPGCRILLDVTVSPKAVAAAREKAVAAVRKKISLPGFRKGKAPDSMIRDKYAKSIDKESEDILLNTTFDEAIKLINIFPFNRNSVKSASVKSLSKEEGAKISYEYECAPHIPTISPNSLKIKNVEIKPVTEQQIERTIQNLSIQSGEWEKLKTGSGRRRLRNHRCR